MKKIIAIIACILCTLGACIVWNEAEVWATATDTNAQLFDCIAVLLLFTALCCSVFYYDQKKPHAGAD